MVAGKGGPCTVDVVCNRRVQGAWTLAMDVVCSLVVVNCFAVVEVNPNQMTA